MAWKTSVFFDNLVFRRVNQYASSAANTTDTVYPVVHIQVAPGEIEDVPTIEEPPRLVRQCHVLARGMYALGHNDEQVEKMMRRIALDSMPAARLAVLRAVAGDDGQSTRRIAQASGLHYLVAHRHCEDLTAVGVVDDLGGDDDKEHRWILRGDAGELTREGHRPVKSDTKRR
jgi:hypothetical protein